MKVPADVARWLTVMSERGWTAPTWPKEYGGGGLSREERRFLGGRDAQPEAPPCLTGFGLTMIGPLLLHEGSEEQKQRASAEDRPREIRWCQGYSEPGAGSDLASLQTRAVPDGDDFVVNGQKIWTSYADRADWMFVLVRTDPNAQKQAASRSLDGHGIPGVSVKPILLISGSFAVLRDVLERRPVPRRNASAR